MVSFVYLGVGELDGTAVFKVGKSSHPKHRRKKLGLQFRAYIACIDSAEAFALERFLHTKIELRGAVRLPNRNDWFYFDETLFEELAFWFEHEADALSAEMYGQIPPAVEQQAVDHWETAANVDLESMRLVELRDRLRERVGQLETQAGIDRVYINSLREQLISTTTELNLYRTGRLRAGGVGHYSSGRMSLTDRETR